MGGGQGALLVSAVPPSIPDNPAVDLPTCLHAPRRVVLWELLTWELPWGATNPWQVRGCSSSAWPHCLFTVAA